MLITERNVGCLLREWRQRRRMSQLDLSFAAGVSSRHLSFIETGRAHPSREMLLKLAERLDIPLRDRNALLASAGFAPAYPERPLDDAALAAARDAIDLVLKGHVPYPALAVDRHWQLVSVNAAVPPLLDGVDAALLERPANVLRLALHPDGLASRTENLAEWRAHLLSRLTHQIEATNDPVLVELKQELLSYPQLESGEGEQGHGSFGDAVIPLKLTTAFGVLSLFSTTTVFGTPRDVTVSELAIEAFYPADRETAEILRRMSPG